MTFLYCTLILTAFYTALFKRAFCKYNREGQTKFREIDGQQTTCANYLSLETTLKIIIKKTNDLALIFIYFCVSQIRSANQ